MKKAMTNTRVSVKLRKADFRNEWYLYLEAYPVYEKGSTTPKRTREYLNRSITTPVWDKSRKARTNAEGHTTYKPKRDASGIIICKSKTDQETCAYADQVRYLRQNEYDHEGLFTDAEASLAEQQEKSQCDFIAYFKQVADRRHANSSDSIRTNWNRVHELLKIYSEGKPILFAHIGMRFLENFKLWLLNAPQGGAKSGTISQNTAATYFAIVKAGLKQAFIDGYLPTDIAAKVKGIQEQESRREYLTLEELNRLVDTPCDLPILKRAALFSSLTGIRHCDIKKMIWKEIDKVGDHYRINFTQKKTKSVEYMPISDQAYELCGDPGHPGQLIFGGLPDISWISRPLKKWIAAAGITKHITFHCFRHTFATLQLLYGSDLFVVSKMLGHTNVRTTQIYAKVVYAMKEKAADTIVLDKIKID